VRSRFDGAINVVGYGAAGDCFDLSCELGSKQYVASTSGMESGFFSGSGTSAVVVFALR